MKDMYMKRTSNPDIVELYIPNHETFLEEWGWEKDDDELFDTVDISGMDDPAAELEALYDCCIYDDEESYWFWFEMEEKGLV